MTKRHGTEPAPEGFSREERLILAVLTLVCAASRFLALARTPWDWDEMLFSLAVRDFDVSVQHPHPPGFPIYVGLAKVVAAFGLTEFRALQVLSLIGGVFLFPASFALCRELSLRFRDSVVASLLLAFAPNVWFYGGAAFSDVPSLTLTIGAAAFLLRDARISDSPARGVGPLSSFIIGCVLLAFATGIRPQSLMIGLVPLAVALWRHGRRYPGAAMTRLVIAVVLIGVVNAAAYGIAVRESGGWEVYSERLRDHQRYITETDSFLAKDRRALYRLVDDFFVRPYRAPLINTMLVILGGAGLIEGVRRRRSGVLLALAMFGPFALFAWLFLDLFSASRFSIGYAPLFAILPARGIDVISAAASSRLTRTLANALVAMVVTTMVVWTWPALSYVRANVTPPLQAVDAARRSLDPARSVLVVDEKMRAFSDYYLADFERVHVGMNAPIVKTSGKEHWLLAETVSDTPGAMNFIWPPHRLWDLARQRYFTVTLAPVR